MSLPTLGFEDDTTLSKIEIARLQLIEAIALFVQTKFLPAVTLAGAAEEILGKLLALRSKLPVINDSVQAIERLRTDKGLNAMDGRNGTEMIRDWNTVRNMLKHLVGPEDEPVTLNLCDEAYWMIRRAVENADRLGLRIDNKQEFENWVIINVNM